MVDVGTQPPSLRIKRLCKISKKFKSYAQTYTLHICILIIFLYHLNWLRNNFTLYYGETISIRRDEKFEVDTWLTAIPAIFTAPSFLLKHLEWCVGAEEGAISGRLAEFDENVGK